MIKIKQFDLSKTTDMNEKNKQTKKKQIKGSWLEG